MKHKHYEMIMAKAGNMDLVVFLENDQGWSEKENQSDIQFHEQFDYFLCLPQYKDFCLHWLNGGALSISTHGLEPSLSSDSWGKAFRPNHPMLRPGHEFKIVAKKEKRWIVVTEDLEIEDGTLYKSYGEAEINNHGTQQVVGIEVEVVK